jgi:hypothetical protein
MVIDVCILSKLRAFVIQNLKTPRQIFMHPRTIVLIDFLPGLTDNPLSSAASVADFLSPSTRSFS